MGFLETRRARARFVLIIAVGICIGFFGAFYGISYGILTLLTLILVIAFFVVLCLAVNWVYRVSSKWIQKGKN